MLGENTKCNLSAGKADICLETLKKQTEKRFYGLVETVQNETADIKNNAMTEEQRKAKLGAMISYKSNTIMRLAKDIAETAELLYTLYHTEDREIKIVEK